MYFVQGRGGKGGFILGGSSMWSSEWKGAILSWLFLFLFFAGKGRVLICPDVVFCKLLERFCFNGKVDIGDSWK